MFCHMFSLQRVRHELQDQGAGWLTRVLVSVMQICLSIINDYQDWKPSITHKQVSP